MLSMITWVVIIKQRRHREAAERSAVAIQLLTLEQGIIKIFPFRINFFYQREFRLSSNDAK